jgi:hypothetical protein
MKTFSLFTILLAALAFSGCAYTGHKKAAAGGSHAIVTPDVSLAARVVSVNTVGRFVVLNFPADKLPKVQQTLFIYRAGLKVAVVKITGPQAESNIVADLISGDPKVGDNVRAD